MPFEQLGFVLFHVLDVYKRQVILVTPYLQRGGLVPAAIDSAIAAKIEQVVAAAGDRIKTAGDVLDFEYFFVADDNLQYDAKALEKSLNKPETSTLLQHYRNMLESAESFDAAHLDQATHKFVEREGIKIGEIIHAVRVGITGQSVGLGLFDSLAIIGRAGCLARIDKTLQRCAAGSA